MARQAIVNAFKQAHILALPALIALIAILAVAVLIRWWMRARRSFARRVYPERLDMIGQTRGIENPLIPRMDRMNDALNSLENSIRRLTGDLGAMRDEAIRSCPLEMFNQLLGSMRGLTDELAALKMERATLRASLSKIPTGMVKTDRRDEVVVLDACDAPPTGEHHAQHLQTGEICGESPAEISAPAADNPTECPLAKAESTNQNTLAQLSRDALALLEKEGNTSRLARMDGLRQWLDTKAGDDIAMEVLNERDGIWLLSVIYSVKSGCGCVLPALDTPLSVDVKLGEWFEYGADYDPRQRLSNRNILDLPQVREEVIEKPQGRLRRWIVEKRGHLRVGAAALVGYLLVAAIGISAATPVNPTTLTHSAERARVYVDTSASMRGFAGSMQFQALLSELKTILVDAHVVTFEVAEVSDKASPPRPVDGFEEFESDKPFHGKETYLPAAIDDAAASANEDVIIVLTDGVVSLSRSRTTTQPQTALGCAAGSDVTCLALDISNYIAAGHGFWVIGIRMPFHGPYFVEQGGPHLPQDAVIYESKQAVHGHTPRRRDTHGHVALLIPQGTFPRRPLYLWIGAPRVEQGRAIARALQDFARRQALDSFGLEVAPGAWGGWLVDFESAHRIAPADVTFCPRGDTLGSMKLTPGGAVQIEANIPARSLFKRYSSPTLGLRIPVRAAFDQPPANLKMLLRYRQEIAVVGSDQSNMGSVPDVDVKSQAPPEGAPENKGLYMDLCLRFRGPLATARDRAVVRLVSRWSQQNTPESPWNAWATGEDDNVESTARTLNLDTFFRVLRNQMTLAPDAEALQMPLLEIAYPAQSK